MNPPSAQDLEAWSKELARWRMEARTSKHLAGEYTQADRQLWTSVEMGFHPGPRANLLATSLMDPAKGAYSAGGPGLHRRWPSEVDSPHSATRAPGDRVHYHFPIGISTDTTGLYSALVGLPLPQVPFGVQGVEPVLAWLHSTPLATWAGLPAFRWQLVHETEHHQVRLVLEQLPYGTLLISHGPNSFPGADWQGLPSEFANVHWVGEMRRQQAWMQAQALKQAWVAH